jgi:ABC-type antimicrobial peptide transport system ATPase subunit
VKTEDVARSLMESKECATLTWGDIADLIQTSGLGEKTSAASIASYASKRKAEWSIVPRERMKFTSADVMAAAALTEDKQVVNG